MTDPSADSIEPPISGGQRANSDEPPAPAPPPADDNAPDDGSEIGRLDQHRAA